MTEKLGHTKRIQTMRREWINERKQREQHNSHDVVKEPDLERALGIPSTQELSGTMTSAQTTEKRISSKPRHQETDSANSDSLHNHDRISRSPNEHFGTPPNDTLFLPDDEDSPDHSEDDLDAFLAETDLNAAKPSSVSHFGVHQRQSENSDRRQSFDDEMEAMAEMDDVW